MVIYLGSLVQLCCREGRTLQRNITGVCGEFSKCLGHTGFAPAHGVCAFPVYTAQAPGCSAGELSKGGPGLCLFPRSTPLGSGSQVPHKDTDSAGPAFCDLPRPSSSGDRVLGECILPRWGSASYHLPHPSRLVSSVRSRSTLSDVPCVSSGELISGSDPPGGC